ncbi:hypothetical protein HDV03_001115 [Kappamyces sp. JEL0829]|nr:hypothetical protein HDV03_001115 [Kappamyces sp. JEL0829]
MTLALQGVGYQSSDSTRNQDGDTAEQKTAKPNSHLEQALLAGSENEYKKALLLENLRDALLEQAALLRSNVYEEIASKSRELAPRVFGWNTTIPGLSKHQHIDENDYEAMWETLRSLEAHQYQLEDPAVSDQFFAELQDMLLHQNLKGLLPKKKKPVKRDTPEAPKKSIAQKRLEEDLANKEAELRKIMNTGFQASTIPASTIIPKYHEIMSQQSNKATTVRLAANLKRKEQLMQSAAAEGKKAPVLGDMLECTFKPAIGHAVPDFQRAQEKFQRILEASRSQKSTTIPVPFAMSTRRSKPQRHAEVQHVPKPAPAKVAFEEPVLVPKSTKSEILKREHLQLRLESEKLVHQLEAEVRSSADEKKRAAAERIRCRLGKSSDGKRLQDRQEKVKQKLEYQKSLEKSFQGQMDDMQKRIDARRCLFEQVQIDAARNQALSSVKQVLAAAGVEIKDLA